MKNNILVIVIVLLLTRCGNAVIGADSRVLGGPVEDTATRLFVETEKTRFLDNCVKYKTPCDTKYLSIKLVIGDIDNEPDTLGIAKLVFGKDDLGNQVMLKNVELRYDVVRNKDYDAKKLIAHELSHAILHADHWDFGFDIMNTFSVVGDKQNQATYPIEFLTDKMFKRFSR